MVGLKTHPTNRFAVNVSYAPSCPPLTTDAAAGLAIAR